MYTPSHFAEDRLEVLHGVIREYSLATLVTHGEDCLVANHIPMLLDTAGRLGTLRGHVSKANTVWKNGSAALAIFQGPRAYITPSAYPSKHEHGRVVPTFNYVVVHAHGQVRWVHDEDWLLTNVRALTVQHEASYDQPWKVEDAPSEFVSGLLKGIVGVEIEIAKLEGKWKVSQNRPENDRAAVAAELRAMADEIDLRR